jgi:hypothetical protein
MQAAPVAVRWGRAALVGMQVESIGVPVQLQRISPSLVPLQSGVGTTHFPSAAQPDPRGYRHSRPDWQSPDSVQDAPAGALPVHERHAATTAE